MNLAAMVSAKMVPTISAVLPEGKPSNVQPQFACQGAMTSEKNVPDSQSLIPTLPRFLLESRESV